MLTLREGFYFISSETVAAAYLHLVSREKAMRKLFYWNMSSSLFYENLRFPMGLSDGAGWRGCWLWRTSNPGPAPPGPSSKTWPPTAWQSCSLTLLYVLLKINFSLSMLFILVFRNCILINIKHGLKEGEALNKILQVNEGKSEQGIRIWKESIE